MNWTRILLLLSDSLIIILIIRLLTLGLHTVYRVFCAYLLFEAFSESCVIVLKSLGLDRYIDYRMLWLPLEIGLWLFSIWMVYSLLQAILRSLPGILRFSKRVMNVLVPVSIAIAILSAAPEYFTKDPAQAHSPFDHVINLAIIFDRLISTAAVLMLLLTLLFILWFPVVMPRNLAVFCVGVTVFFTAKTSVLLLHTFWSHNKFNLIDNILIGISGLCFAYWIVFLNKQGEKAPVTIGHSWRPATQTKLIGDLESINAALARATHR